MGVYFEHGARMTTRENFALKYAIFRKKVMAIFLRLDGVALIEKSMQ